MSRATVDLQSIRFFLGYGLIWVSQSFLTIAVRRDGDVRHQPRASRPLALAPVPFLIATATRYSRRNRPAEQEVQQRVGEVTASAEESISGIRIVKAFAREGFMIGRFRHAVDRVFDQSMVTTRLQSFYTPLMGFLPTIGHRGGAAGRRPPGRQRHDQHRRVHGVQRLRDHALGPGSLARDVAEHGPARRRLGQPPVRDPRPRAVDAEPARRAGRFPPAAAASRCADVALRYNGGEPSLTGIDLEVEPGGTVALVGPTASGKTSLVGLLARLYDPSEGSVRDRRRRHPRGRPRLAALRDRLRRRRQLPVLRHRRRPTSPTPHPEATQEQIELAARRAQAARLHRGAPRRLRDRRRRARA